MFPTFPYNKWLVWGPHQPHRNPSISERGVSGLPSLCACAMAFSKGGITMNQP